MSALSSRRTAFAVAAGLLGSACAVVLGIEDKPLRPEVVEVGPEVGPDAGTPRCEDPPRVCACARHDFCDDFDAPDAAVFAAWKDDSGTPNQILLGEASVALVTDAHSPPRALQATARKDSYLTPTAAVGLSRLDFDALHPGQRVAGIRLGFHVRLVNIAVPNPDDPERDAGPIPRLGSAGIGGLVGEPRPSAQPAGVGLIVANERVYLATTSNVFAGNVADDYALVYDSPVGALSVTWLSVEMVVTSRDRAVALGYADCSGLPDGPVGAAAFIGSFRKCLPLRGALADAYPAWLKTAGVSVGGIVFDPGSATVAYDDVIADFIVE